MVNNLLMYKHKYKPLTHISLALPAMCISARLRALSCIPAPNRSLRRFLGAECLAETALFGPFAPSDLSPIQRSFHIAYTLLCQCNCYLKLLEASEYVHF